MPENPRLLNLGMNGILSKPQLAGAEQISACFSMPEDLKPWALAQGVVHLNHISYIFVKVGAEILLTDERLLY